MKKDIGVYKYVNVIENFRIIKKGMVFSVYGYMNVVWVVLGGFV